MSQLNSSASVSTLCDVLLFFLGFDKVSGQFTLSSKGLGDEHFRLGDEHFLEEEEEEVRRAADRHYESVRQHADHRLRMLEPRGKLGK